MVFALYKAVSFVTVCASSGGDNTECIAANADGSSTQHQPDNQTTDAPTDTACDELQTVADVSAKLENTSESVDTLTTTDDAKIVDNEGEKQENLENEGACSSENASHQLPDHTQSIYQVKWIKFKGKLRHVINGFIK